MQHLFIREMFDLDGLLCCYSLIVCECSARSLCLVIAELSKDNVQSCTLAVFDTSSVELSPTTKIYLGYILMCTFLVCPLHFAGIFEKGIQS